MSSNAQHIVTANRQNSGPTPQGLTSTDSTAQGRKLRSKPSNPLQRALFDFLEQHHSVSSNGSTCSIAQDLISKLPKRYSLYPPFLLLPTNVFTALPAWRDFCSGLSAAEKEEMYACIARTFSRQGSEVTHIAVNAPIAAEVDTNGGEGKSREANTMRSPTGLVPLYGDWGPRNLVTPVGGDGLFEVGQPTKEDLRRAFWARAVQNGGIVQVWAPLWTMFSRGNVKEKARILGEGDSMFEGLDDRRADFPDGALDDISAVDLFVGIGYFAFSYLKRGVGVVWGWEINGWSVEGLRRGCKENGWRVEILRVRGDGLVVDEKGREGDEVLESLVESLDMAEEGREKVRETRCVVFYGDNRWSGKIMTSLREISLQRRVNGKWKRVRHVNLGLLPRARESWQNSVEILDSVIGGWLHVHENVDVRDYHSRKAEIVEEIGKLVAADVAKRGQWKTSCCHLEEVKTYAPGVMHCVFDIQISPAR